MIDMIKDTLSNFDLQASLQVSLSSPVKGEGKNGACPPRNSILEARPRNGSL